MSGKERLEAAMRREPVDRIPWAPKVFIGHYRRGTAQHYRDMSVADFADILNSDAIAWEHLVERRCEGLTTDVTREGSKTAQIIRTPVGEIRSVSEWNTLTQSGHPLEHPLKTPQDYKVAQYIAEHSSYQPIAGAHAEMVRSVGDRGVVCSFGDGTPFMELLQSSIGIPQIYYHTQDHPEAFAELFHALTDRCVRYYEAYAKSDADTIVIHENTSSSLLSPAIYREYCLPIKKRICEIVKKAGKTFILHMCGTLKDLLPLIREVGADAWESFTPPPNGDVYFKDGRAAVEDVALMGGMNAVMLTSWSEQKLFQYVDETLANLPDKRGLVFTSGGAMPIECPVEKLAGLGKKLAPHLSGR